MTGGGGWTRVVKADEHVRDMEILLGALPREVPRRGVVHVGAHRGEELAVLRAAGFGPFLLVEANPDHAREIRELHPDPEVEVLSCAIGDRVGEADLLLHTSRSGSTEPASLLPMEELGRIVPTLSTASKVRVPITTLDQLARDGRLPPGRFNLLVVDVQGAEQMVFRGAREWLPTLDAIVTEVNTIPLYEGAALEAELLAELAAFGFHPRHGVYHELYRGDDRFVAWGECVLVHERHGTRE